MTRMGMTITAMRRTPTNMITTINMVTTITGMAMALRTNLPR